MRIDTPAQKITKVICRHKANKEGKILSGKFYDEPEWKSFFKQQIITANQLLRIYPLEAILKALDDKRCKNTYSLRAPWLDKIIEEYVKQEEKQITIETTPITPTFKKQAKKGIRDE